MTAERDSIFDVVAILRLRWQLIVGCALTAFAATFIVTEFLMPHFYRATAILRPVTEQGAMNRLQGMAAVGMPSLGGMLGNANDDKAEEYVSILQSYDFTMAVVQQARIAKALDPSPRAWDPFSPSKWTDWQTFLVMQQRFDCTYDRFTGNITLHFLDPDPAEARRILRVYVDYLRDKLRREEVLGASDAVLSLRDEARATADTLMQAQLYELIARQLQRQKIAQVQADFAFKVIDAPVVADTPYVPRIFVDATLSGLLAGFLAVFAVLANRSRRLHQGD